MITEEIKNLMQLGTSQTTARDGASKAEISAGPTTARDGASKAGVTRLLAMQHSTNFSSPTTVCWRCPTATGDVVNTEVAVPWESSPSTWMLPSQNGVLDAFLDSLPATGTEAVDRMPESSAETAEETAEETVVSADDPDWGSTSPPPSPPPRPPPEPASPLFGKSRRIAETTFAEVTETSAEPVEPVAVT